MEVSYWFYGDDFKQHSDLLDKEQVVELPIMDLKDKMWTRAKVMLFQKPVEGGEPVGLLGPFGEPFDQGRYYAKILEILPEEE